MIANINYPISYAHASPSPSHKQAKHKRGHGGARNFAKRLSVAISLAKAIELRDAWTFADWQGRTLNYWITIHWGRMNIDDCEAGAALNAFLSYVRQWLTKAGHYHAAIYARENGFSKGSHVHILLYLPHALQRDIRARAMQWLTLIARGPIPSQSLTCKKVRNYKKGEPRPRDPQSPAAQVGLRDNSLNLLRYLLKGIERRFAPIFELTLLEDGGTIMGKRTGTSDSLGKAAREGAGFTPPHIDPLTGKPDKKK